MDKKGTSVAASKAARTGRKLWWYRSPWIGEANIGSSGNGRDTTAMRARSVALRNLSSSYAVITLALYNHYKSCIHTCYQISICICT